MGKNKFVAIDEVASDHKIASVRVAGVPDFHLADIMRGVADAAVARGVDLRAGEVADLAIALGQESIWQCMESRWWVRRRIRSRRAPRWHVVSARARAPGPHIRRRRKSEPDPYRGGNGSTDGRGAEARGGASRQGGECASGRSEHQSPEAVDHETW